MKVEIDIDSNWENLEPYFYKRLDEHISDSAYLYVPNSYKGEFNPLVVGMFWDDGPDFQKQLLKLNLRDQYLEIFKDDPEYYRDKINLTAKALRDLADEIETI